MKILSLWKASQRSEKLYLPAFRRWGSLILLLPPYLWLSQVIYSGSQLGNGLALHFPSRQVESLWSGSAYLLNMVLGLAGCIFFSLVVVFQISFPQIFWRGTSISIRQLRTLRFHQCHVKQLRMLRKYRGDRLYKSLEYDLVLENAHNYALILSLDFHSTQKLLRYLLLHGVAIEDDLVEYFC